VASTDAGDRLAIGRAAYRGRWWPDTQQFDEIVGFPAPTCTYWRYRGWTAPLVPVAVDIGERRVRAWQSAGPSPLHRRPDTRRWCRVLEFDRSCQRAVSCHAWETEADQSGAFLLVESDADARALYEHARMRRQSGASSAVPPIHPVAGSTAPQVQAAPPAQTAAAASPGAQPQIAPYDDPRFIANCQAHAMLERITRRETGANEDPRTKALRELWPQRLKELVPDEPERLAIAREATMAAAARVRARRGEGTSQQAQQASDRLLRVDFAAVEMRCLMAIPTAHPIFRELPR
jgi:hypothetical protein